MDGEDVDYGQDYIEEEEEEYSEDYNEDEAADDDNNGRNNYRNHPRKRPYEGDYDGPGENQGFGRAKRQSRGRDVLFRIVVASNKIGRVIGKQGSRINQLRESTGARIKIADPVSPQEDRVIIISSKGEELYETSAAEHALIDIVTVILEENGESTSTPRAGLRHVGPNMIRLLIAGSQAGSLIGVSGKTVKEIRNDTGASIQIMPENHLPVCASASETDRLVQVSGEVSQVLRALEQIGSVLREHPPKEVISMNPTYFGPPGGNGSMMLPPALFPAYPMPPMQPGLSYMGFGMAPVSALPKVRVKVNVPSSVVGGLIGRRGSNISHIRSVSGATVKVMGEKDVATRTIFFEGTAQQVSMAQNLVNSLILSQPKYP